MSEDDWQYDAVKEAHDHAVLAFWMRGFPVLLGGAIALAFGPLYLMTIHGASTDIAGVDWRTLAILVTVIVLVLACIWCYPRRDDAVLGAVDLDQDC